MRCLVDNQLPLQLARHLAGHGHDVVHVVDVGLDEATDQRVWDWATREGRVVISKDEDFVFLAHRPRDVGLLLWVRLGNCRKDALIEAFDRVWTRWSPPSTRASASSSSGEPVSVSAAQRARWRSGPRGPAVTAVAFCSCCTRDRAVAEAPRRANGEPGRQRALSA